MTTPVPTKQQPGKVAVSAALTFAQVKAAAPRLSGAQSRVARAATADSDPAPAETSSVGELWLYGVVGGWWRGFDAESVANALRGLDVEVLYVRIHSPGGLASDGVAIANLLRNHKAKVVVVVDGLAASSASVIAIAGDEIVMCPGSQMMLHDAATGMWGNAAELRRAADWVDNQSNNYAGVYAHKAGGTPAEWRQVMLADDGWGTWYTADEAVAAGLADSVGTRQAVGSPPTTPEDQLDEDDDEMLARAAHDLALLEQYVHPAARAVWQGDPKPPTARPRTGQPTQEGSPAVAFSDEQVTTMRQKLGIAEDADEATILAALDEALEERSDPPAAAPVLKEGQKIVSRAAWDDLATKAQIGVDAATKLHNQERTAFLDAHRNRYPASSRATWEKEYDLDPAGTRTYLAQAAVLIPTNELGHGGEGDQPVAVADQPGYKNWKV